MEIQDTLRNYILKERFGGQAPPDFSDDFDLINSGSIDSVFLVGLIIYVEAQFPVELLMNDFVPRNFRSVNSMSELVRNRMKPGVEQVAHHSA